MWMVSPWSFSGEFTAETAEFTEVFRNSQRSQRALRLIPARNLGRTPCLVLIAAQG